MRETDRGLRRLREAWRLASGTTTVKVGLIEGGRERDPADGVTNAQLGAIHEFGSSNVPARPWLLPAIKKNHDKYVATIRTIATQILAGKMTTVRGLNLLGAMAATDVKNYVTQGTPIPPPNAPSTLWRKVKGARGMDRLDAAVGQVRTLVDTGRMIGAVTWRVVRGAVSG